MPRKIQFGVYELDLELLELHKHGIAVRLQEQPGRVLASLLIRPGEIVTRQELKAAIWPSDTFVEFDQSLNKAVNRLRSALNDDAAHPRYIETVPRRGYRFVAPVTDPRPTEPPQPSYYGRQAISPSLGATLVGGIILACLIIFVAVRKPHAPHQHLLTRMTMDGASVFPALSRDGKLLAYASSAGGDVQHVWVRQTAGGEPIQVTSGDIGSSAPSFSPDGTKIAFGSLGGDASVFVVPSLGGQPTLVAKHAQFPKFSPDGTRLLYLNTDRGFEASVVSLQSGQTTPLDLIIGTLPTGALIGPIWSPTGEDVLFYGLDRPSLKDQEPCWRIKPLRGGQSRIVALDRLGAGAAGRPVAHAWTRSEDGREWIVYSSSTGEGRSLFRVAISRQADLFSNPERLTSGISSISEATVSQDGKLAFTAGQVAERIYFVPASAKGREDLPNPFHLTGSEGIRNLSPSLSKDGRWMAYATTDETDSGTKIRMKNLTTGVDRVVSEKSDKFDRDFLSIAPDGSKVVFSELEASLSRRQHASVISSFVVSAAGGPAEKICDFCLPRGFRSDGAAILMQSPVSGGNELDHISLIDLTSKAQRVFLKDPNRPLFHAFFSWDDHWVVFKKLVSWNHGQLLIARVSEKIPVPQTEWIAVTDGSYDDDKPQFSGDGNTLYFTSNRDGYLCIWAIRLNRVTKQPESAPFVVQHLHNAAGWYSGAYYHFGAVLSAATDKIAVNLLEPREDIWMTNIR